ncbi:MAG: hypothetical protein GEU81_14185, partial [Nitriliruptorales bacterium]|nr:hypothetical protein [Nitriliruptorales bacterium]
MQRVVDLPVSVELPGALGQEVSGYVEVEAGWQVVAPEGPPAPALALRAEPAPGPPCIVIVEGAPSAQQVREGLLAGALDVLGWPDDRDRLLEAPPRLRAVDPVKRTGHGPRLLRIGGVAGGAGASTLSLAIGGLLAWSGQLTVVVGEEDMLELCGLGGWTGPGAAELAALDAAAAAAEVPGLLRPVAGVDRLSVLGGSGRSVRTCAGWPVDAVVADLRAEALPEAAVLDAREAARLLVARPDGSLRRASGVPVPVILMGSGPLDGAGAHRLL